MSSQLTIMNPSVTIHDGKAVTTTEDIARYFGKQHHHVVQKLESLECSKDFTIRNFSRMVKKQSIGCGAEREISYYEMTKDGFVFLVMGFTGKKAAEFKEAYIAEFNRMEASLYQAKPLTPALPSGPLTPDQQIAIKELVRFRAESVPQEKRGKACISMWSALKSHFGTTYKEINSAQFTEALSLVARIPLSEEQLAPPQEPTFPYRWLVSNYFGEVKYKPVPINANVMTTEGFLKALIDDRKPVDNQTLCDFVVAATQRLCQKSA